MTKSSPFHVIISAAVSLSALCAGAGIAHAQFKQTNLVSDVPGLAAITDPNLVNTWGVSNLPGSPFWISNQGTSTTSLDSGAKRNALKRSGFEHPFQARQVRLGMAS
jgi:hypothetical protein